MYRIDHITIKPDVPDEIKKLSEDLVGYVYDKRLRKVVDTAVVKRVALADWYAGRRKKFPEEHFIFCISATSTVGIVLGMETQEFDSKPEEDDPNKPKGGGGKKNSWNYHVN